MKFSRIIITCLLLFFSAFMTAYALLGDSVWINGEGLLIFAVLTCVLIVILLKAGNISYSLCIVLTYYVFTKYILGTINLFLLSHWGSSYWMVENYAWAGSADVNRWLWDAVIYTSACGAGIILGSRIILRSGNRPFLKNSDKELKMSPAALLWAYIILTALILVNFYRFGYGSISGIDTDPIFTLYGLLSNEPVLLITLVIVAFQWRKLSGKYKLILLFIIISNVILRTLQGSRSSTYFLFVYFIFLLCVFKGDFVIRKVHLFFLAVLIISGFLLYPIGKAFKEAIKSKGNKGNYLELNVDILSRAGSLNNGLKRLSLEIVDRLSDVGSSLRISNDKQVVQVSSQVSLANTIKRTINDMTPGDVFTDVSKTQDVYHLLYFGYAPVYGGEIYGIFGVYYLLFGRLGALLALFLTSAAIGYFWKIAIFSNIALKPVYLGYYVIIFDWFLFNTLIEGWLVNSVFKPLLSLFLTLLVISSISKLGKALFLKPLLVRDNGTH